MCFPRKPFSPRYSKEVIFVRLIIRGRPVQKTSPPAQQPSVNSIDRLARCIEPCVLSAANEIAPQALSCAENFVGHPCVAMNLMEEAAAKAANSRRSSISDLERRKATIEQQIANCTEAIADGQPSRFLIAKLGELERELETVAGKIVCSQPEAVRSCIRDTRRFVEVHQRDLRKLLNSEPRIARAAIGKHVQKITLTPEGRAFINGAGGQTCTILPQSKFFVDLAV